MEGRRGEVATGLIGVSIARSFVVFQRDSELHAAIHRFAVTIRSPSIDSQRVDAFRSTCASLRLRDDAIVKKKKSFIRVHCASFRV